MILRTAPAGTLHARLEGQATRLTEAALEAWQQFDTRRSIELSKQVLSLGLPDSSLILVRARLRLIHALISVGKIAAAKVEIERVESFNGLLSLADVAMLLKVRGLVEAVQGRSEWSLYFGQYATTLASQPATLSEQRRMVLHDHGFFAQTHGSLEEAASHYKKASEIAEAADHVWATAYEFASLAYVEYLSGDIPAARATIERALQVPATLAIASFKRAWVAVLIASAIGDDDLFLAHFDLNALPIIFGSHDPGSIGPATAAYASALERMGRAQDVPEIVERAVRSLRSIDGAWAFLPVVATYGSEASIARIHKMIAASQQPGNTPEGFFSLYRAFLERRAEHWAEARKHADRAHKLLVGSGYLLHAAMCHEAAGRFSLAAAEYQRLGNVADARLAKRRRGPRGRPASDQLSAIQREIVFLVQEGATIAQIAQRIDRAPCTISHHLATIYDKLGVKGKANLLRYELT